MWQKSRVLLFKMLEKFFIKLQGEQNIKMKVNQTLYGLDKSVGEIELLVSLVKEGKEIKSAKEKLPHHLEIYKNLSIINKGVQKSKPRAEYLIEFNNKFSDLLIEYGEKIEQLRSLI